MTCKDTADCNHHGDCIDKSCLCDLGWFGTSCEESGKEKWGEAWEAFVVIFVVSYSVFLFLSVIKLYTIISPERFIGFRRLSRRIISSPKNLSLCCLCLVSLIKILWLSIDPLVFEEKANRLVDRLLFETVYPFFFCMYGSVLLVLAGLYQGIQYKKSMILGIVRKVLIGIIIAGFPVTWTLSTIKGLRLSKQWIYSLGYSLIASAAVVLALGYIVMVVLLCCSITRQSHRYSSTDPNFSPIESQRENFKFEHVISRDSSMAKVSLQEESDRSILIMSVEDKFVLTKIIILSILSFVLGICTVLIFTIFNDLDTEEDSAFFITGLFFGFSLENIGCLFIFFFFTAQIRVQPRETLKEFSKIALKKRHFYSKVAIKDEGLKHISKRLENYFSK